MTSAELLDAGVSCCIPVSDDGPALLKADRTRTVVCAVIGFGLAGLCGLLVLLSLRRVIQEPPGYVLAACMFSGIGFLFYGGMYGQRGTIKKVVRRRLGALPLVRIHAELEDTRTVDRLKWSPEDIVLVIPDPERRLLSLEGLRYRYVIRSEDVVMVEHAGPKKRVRIDYRIGETVLSFVLIHKSMIAEFASMVGLGTFRDRLVAALGVAERTGGFEISLASPGAPMDWEEIVGRNRNAPIGATIRPVAALLAAKPVLVALWDEAPQEKPGQTDLLLKIKTAQDNQGRMWAYAYSNQAEFSRAFPRGGQYAEMSFADFFKIIDAAQNFAGVVLNSNSASFYPIPREVFREVRETLSSTVPDRAF